MVEFTFTLCDEREVTCTTQNEVLEFIADNKPEVIGITITGFGMTLFFGEEEDMYWYRQLNNQDGYFLHAEKVWDEVFQHLLDM